MDIKNYFLKRRQRKAIQQSMDYEFLPYNCPKCHFGTDTLKAYVVHLENHLIKKSKSKIK